VVLVVVRGLLCSGIMWRFRRVLGHELDALRILPRIRRPKKSGKTSSPNIAIARQSSFR
jgi:hypothetical protein